MYRKSGSVPENLLSVIHINLKERVAGKFVWYCQVLMFVYFVSCGCWRLDKLIYIISSVQYYVSCVGKYEQTFLMLTSGQMVRKNNTIAERWYINGFYLPRPGAFFWLLSIYDSRWVSSFRIWSSPRKLRKCQGFGSPEVGKFWASATN